MTSELAFECLFISSDPELFRVVARILRELSISIEICLRPSRALEFLQSGNPDLVVLDWEAGDSAELVQTIRNETTKSKPTLVAISASDSRLPGAHMVIRKPMTAESGAQSFRTVYQHMLVDYRRKVRHALMTSTLR